MGSSIYQAVKNPNVVQTAAMEDSNILLVLSVSMPQTLVNRPQAHYLHSTSASCMSKPWRAVVSFPLTSVPTSIAAVCVLRYYSWQSYKVTSCSPSPFRSALCLSFTHYHEYIEAIGFLLISKEIYSIGSLKAFHFSLDTFTFHVFHLWAELWTLCLLPSLSLHLYNVQFLCISLSFFGSCCSFPVVILYELCGLDSEFWEETTRSLLYMASFS